jgi:DNA repair protein RecO
MKHNWEQHEGVLLQIIPYLEESLIYKIFTPQAGLITVLAKSKGSAIPFCRAEWVVRRSRGDLYYLQESSLIDPHHHLRSSFPVISAAGAIATDLIRSQLPSTSATNLYLLLLACWTHLAKNPEAIAFSFRLKLLQLEGVFCIQLLNDLPFEEAERKIVRTLAFAKRFSELEDLHLSLCFACKLRSVLNKRQHE